MSLEKASRWLTRVYRKEEGTKLWKGMLDHDSAITALRREEIIQTITGCLLDGKVMDFSPETLIAESYNFYRRVLAREADIDIDWLCGRKENPTTREPNNATFTSRTAKAAPSWRDKTATRMNDVLYAVRSDAVRGKEASEGLANEEDEEQERR